MTPKRTLLSLVLTVLMAGGLHNSPTAASAHGRHHPERQQPPAVITLPDAWNAEGIATGRGPTVYAGSLSSGAVWQGDLRTGTGSVLVPAQAGRAAVGLKYAHGLLFVAGGPTGAAYVYDARTGADVATVQLTTGTSFVNDVVVTRRAAYFTDSMNAVLYRVPLRSGAPAGTPTTIPLSGDWVQVAGQFNANGIESLAGGRHLIVVNSTTGTLFRVNPRTGRASTIETDATLTQGDGILLRGSRLSVVRNRSNEIAVLRVNHSASRARLVATLTDPDFAVPTTIAAYRGSLYAVNARFGLPAGPFTIVRVDGR